jgi:hypothetical protein
LRCVRFDIEEICSLCALIRTTLSQHKYHFAIPSTRRQLNHGAFSSPHSPLKFRLSPNRPHAQNCCIEEFTRMSAFISGTTWDTLYKMMSVPSEPELRALLTSSIFLNPRIQPIQKLTDTCERIADWLQLHGRHASASKYNTPVALVILLRFRVCNAGKGALCGYGDEVKLVVEIKIAYGNTCDHWMRGSS